MDYFSSSSKSYSLIFIFLISLAFFSLNKVEGVHEKELKIIHHAVEVESLLPKSECSLPPPAKGTKKAGGIPVVHRHGPCSPLTVGKVPTSEQILDADQAHADYLQNRYSANSQRTNRRSKPVKASAIPANTGASVGTGNYIVTIGFGTPPKSQTIVMDTGSDVTWIQCQPCVGSCYKQKDPTFDPTKSSTYSNISCSSKYCNELDTHRCDRTGATCIYGVQYGDGSFTVGYYAQDKLTLPPSDSVQNFRFGCGENNQGLFGQADGLLGLGRQSESFVSQTATKYGGVFSYCLPASSSSAGYLNFGRKPNTAGVQYTSMLTDSSSPSFYFLNLIGILVGGKKLQIPQSVFSNAGTIIDSGTVISRLPPAAYDPLKTAFRQQMTQYPMAPAVSILDTCYDFSNYTTVSIPKVALLYDGGVTMDLAFEGVLYVLSRSQACLGFAGNSDASTIGIIGNTQQRKMNVVYDVSKKLVGFGSGGC